jgi:hypothetical protein
VNLKFFWCSWVFSGTFLHTQKIIVFFCRTGHVRCVRVEVLLPERRGLKIYINTTGKVRLGFFLSDIA